MKSNSSIELTKAWWKKEGPDSLKKSGPAFEKAVDEYAKARAGLEGKGETAAKALEKAIDALEKAAKDVASEAKELEKKVSDKAAKTDLKNTADVMGKPLERALMEARAAIAAELEPPEDDGDEDEEASDDKLVDPALHGAYIKKIGAKLKRGTWNFAVGLPSNDPAAMRFNFHRKKGGRALGAQLKKACGAKKFTFGKAGTSDLAADVSGEDTSARTLVLYLEGRRIPGLAKRVKLMLRQLKVSAFGKVKIVVDGEEIDGADDDALDTPLEAFDLDTPDAEDDTDEAEIPAAPPPPPRAATDTVADTGTDTAAEIPAAPPPPGTTPEAPPPDGRAVALARRLTAVNEALAGMQDEGAAKLREAAKGALARLRSGDLDGAEKLIEALEGRIGTAPAAPPPPPSARAAETPPEAPPAPDGQDARAEQIRRALGALVKRIRALDDPGTAQPLEARAGGVLGLLREGQLQDAGSEVAALAEAIDQAELDGALAAAGTDPLAIWIAGKEIADTGIEALQNALRGFDHADLQRIAEHGLYGATEGNQVALNKALREYKAAPDADRRALLAQQVSQFRQFLASNPLVKLCERNPFGVKVEIVRPLGRALDRIEETVNG